MKNITKLTRLAILGEITRLQSNDEYWGTQQNVENESIIFETFLAEGLVTQDWFDDKEEHTNIELLKELLKV